MGADVATALSALPSFHFLVSVTRSFEDLVRVCSITRSELRPAQYQKTAGEFMKYV